MAQQKIYIDTTQWEIDQKKLAKESRSWLKATTDKFHFQLAVLNLKEKGDLMSSLNRRGKKGKQLPYRIKKKNGDVVSLSFLFIKHGIYLARGVGKGRRANSSAANAAAKNWIKAVLKPSTEELADNLAEFYSDELTDELKILIPGIIEERIK